MTKKKTKKESGVSPGKPGRNATASAVVELYRQLVRTSRDIIYSMDSSGILLYISDQAAFYGFKPAEVQGRNFIEFIHPDDRQRMLEEFSRSIETGEEFPSWFRIVNSEGNTLWVEDLGAVQKDDKGCVTGIVGLLRDITDRKRGEAELDRYKQHLQELVEDRTRQLSSANKMLEREIETRRETTTRLARSEELYRAVVDTMSEGMGIADTNGKIIFANNALCRLCGYSGEELYSRDFTDLIADEYRKVLSAQYEKRKHGKLKGQRRYRVDMICADRSRKPVEIAPRPIVDEQGQFKGSVAVITDVSEQIKTGRALRESGERYRLLIDNAGVTIYLVSEQGRVLLCNNLAAAYLGHSPDEVSGKTLEELLEPRQATRHLMHIRRAIETGREVRVTYHAKLACRDSWFRVSIQPFAYEQDIPAAQVIAHDITELKEIQRQLRRERDSLEERVAQNVAALRESEQRVQQRLRELTCLYNIRQEFDRDNAIEETLFGCARIILDALHAPEHKSVTINLDGREWATVHRRGSTDNCLEQPLVVAGANRGFLRVSAAGTEIEFLPFEQDLVTYAGNSLSDFILNHELRRQLINSEKMAAAGRLAAGVAHEINNPLGAIKNSLHIIKNAFPRDNEDYMFVELMDHEIDRVAGIVAQLYNLYRPSASELHPVNLGEVAENVLKMLQSQIQRRKIEVSNEITAPGPMLKLSVNQITQVMYNIILNALQAMPLGGRLTIGCTKTGTGIDLWITDTGTGIPDDVLPNIFEPFFSTKTKGSHVNEGMGVGLSLSRSFIEAMGGKIAVKTKPGWGSTFTLSFPPRKARRSRGR